MTISTVEYSRVEHLVVRQHQFEQTFLSEYSEKSFSIASPFVKLDPYQLNPLAALIMFKTRMPATATVTVKGKEKGGDIAYTYNSTIDHVLPVLGLYPDYENTVEIVLSTREKKTLTIKTEKMHELVRTPRKIEAFPGVMAGQLLFLAPTGKTLPQAVDYAGDIRWVLSDFFAFDLTRFNNGHIVIGSNRLMHPKYHMSGLVELNMIGKIYAEYRMPGCYHHDQVEMDDGNILTLSQDFKTDTVEDMAVLIDRKTGDIIKTWDFKKVLPQDAGKSFHWCKKDWFHGNSIDYDKKNHAVIVSGRHQDAIISLDFETGNLNWIIGDPEGWPEDMVRKYFFTPMQNKEFEWQYEQHDARLTPLGDITCFDNGTGRSKNPAKYLLNRNNYSRGVCYRIDTDAMTIEQRWQFGKEEGSDFFSPYICNVECYNEDHYLVHSGGIAFENGVTSEKLGSRLDEDDPDVDLFSRTVEVREGRIIYDVEINGQFYRAKKYSLYSKNESLEFGKGKVLGSHDITLETDMDISFEKTGAMVPEEYHVSLIEEDDRIVFKGRFEKGTLALLVLRQEEAYNQYFINTSTDADKALCVATFVDKDDRWVRLSVNKVGLDGKYTVKLFIEDKLYDTGITITV